MIADLSYIPRYVVCVRSVFSLQASPPIVKRKQIIKLIRLLSATVDYPWKCVCHSFD